MESERTGQKDPEPEPHPTGQEVELTLEKGQHRFTFWTFLTICCPRPAGHVHCTPPFQDLGEDRGRWGPSHSLATSTLCVIGQVPSPLWAVGRVETGGDWMIFKALSGLCVGSEPPPHTGLQLQDTAGREASRLPRASRAQARSRTHWLLGQNPLKGSGDELQ